MVKIGDKVRFLNSTGGGQVNEFRGKNMVLVEDESGFDFPVLISECVVVGEGESNFKVQGSRFKVQDSASPPDPLSEREGKYLTSDERLEAKASVQPKPTAQKPAIKETPEGERLSAYIAFLPVDPKAMMQSAYEAWFINDSNYYLYFTYLSRLNNSWTCRYEGQIEPNTKVFMEEFGKESLNDIENICIQLIAFKKEKPFGLKNTLSVELRLDTVKFYKLHCFMENDYFDEEALIFAVVQNDIPERQLLVTATELQEAMLAQKRDFRRNPQPVKKSAKTVDPVIEIDLHINQLLDTTKGMSAGDILNYQLNKFHEVMKQYIGKKGQQIVFIHGKGEGILRTTIEKELKTKYKSCIFQDASFQEYGFGATIVKIR